MLTMYNSFSNVTESIGNHKIMLHWPDGPSHTPFEITLVDGYYDSVNFYTYLKRQLDVMRLYTIVCVKRQATPDRDSDQHFFESHVYHDFTLFIHRLRDTMTPPREFAAGERRGAE